MSYILVFSKITPTGSHSPNLVLIFVLARILIPVNAMEFNETLELGLEHPILSNHIQKYGRKPCLGGRRRRRWQIVVGPVGAVGLSVDSPICRSVVRVRIPDSVQLVVSLGRTLSSHCPAALQTALSKT